MKTRNLKFNALGFFFLLSMVGFVACDREDMEIRDEQIDEVQPEEETEVEKAFFKMNDANTNQTIVNTEVTLAESIMTFDLYGTADEGYVYTGTDSVWSTLYTIGISDSIQFFWRYDDVVGPHTYSFDANTSPTGELFYTIINPVSNQPGDIFGLRKLDMTITSVGAVNQLIEGNYTAELQIRTGGYKQVSGSFAVPRFR